ncbi:hypothetical protein GHT06_012272 [Daphnia sinensis]|uniref:Uncharacterized protein n=1 Tax=Daphnia sinensis TaxID=1820382 RepID=A0AAD5PVJ1_9CRUS|nr:hypothetical protein GHT06_012272 [Daphnia sinensis]
MKLHHLSILFLCVVLLLVASSVEAGRRRRQLNTSPTVYRAHFNRPSFTRNPVRQPFVGRPVRYRAYIRDAADLSTLRYRVRVPRRPEVINAAIPFHLNHRRYMKFDYEHPDHYHIYHS